LASEKQIAANRANAKKSTGPKTAAGKLKSSQNAYFHGLTSPLQLDHASLAKVEVLVRTVTDEDESEAKLKSAAEFAKAQVQLERIRTTREKLMATFDPKQPDVRTLQRLAALDRLERYAITERRRALRTI
jgi:hypothetical protein